MGAIGALLCGLAGALVVAAAILIHHESPACRLSAHEALPDLQAYRAACPPEPRQ